MTIASNRTNVYKEMLNAISYKITDIRLATVIRITYQDQLLYLCESAEIEPVISVRHSD